MYLDILIKDEAGKVFSNYYVQTRHCLRTETCCGILEYGSTYLNVVKRTSFHPALTSDQKKAAKTRKQADRMIINAMKRDFGPFKVVVMTDKKGGYNEQLFDLFNDPQWTKHKIDSEMPSHSTRRKLVTMVLTKKPKPKKKVNV